MSEYWPPLSLDDLLARAEIADVLTRYARGIDRLDWDLVRDCYHPDAYDDHGGIAGTVDDFISGGQSYLRRFAATMHFLGNMLIEVDGDRARAETYAVAYHRQENPDGSGKDDIFGIRYVDRFERRNDRWRIAHRVVANEWRRVEDVPAGKGRKAYDAVWGSRDGEDVIHWIMGASAPSAAGTD